MKKFRICFGLFMMVIALLYGLTDPGMGEAWIPAMLMFVLAASTVIYGGE